MNETIYINLLDEGTTVRRPAPAYRRPDGAYIVLRPRDYDPSIETWEFPPGSVVECRPVPASEGEILAAVRSIEDQDVAPGRRAV